MRPAPRPAAPAPDATAAPACHVDGPDPESATCRCQPHGSAGPGGDGTLRSGARPTTQDLRIGDRRRSSVGQEFVRVPPLRRPAPVTRVYLPATEPRSDPTPSLARTVHLEVSHQL